MNQHHYLLRGFSWWISLMKGQKSWQNDMARVTLVNVYVPPHNILCVYIFVAYMWSNNWLGPSLMSKECQINSTHLIYCVPIVPEEFKHKARHFGYSFFFSKVCLSFALVLMLVFSSSFSFSIFMCVCLCSSSVKQIISHRQHHQLIAPKLSLRICNWVQKILLAYANKCGVLSELSHKILHVKWLVHTHTHFQIERFLHILSH